MIQLWKGLEARELITFYYEPGSRRWLRDTLRVAELVPPEDLHMAVFGSDIGWTPPWHEQGGPVIVGINYTCSGFRNPDDMEERVELEPGTIDLQQGSATFTMQPKFWRAQVIWMHAEQQILEHAATTDWPAVASNRK